MSDNVQASAAVGSGPIFKTDQDSGDNSHAPFIKLMFGPLDTFSIVGLGAGLPVQPATGMTFVVNDKPIAAGGLAMHKLISGASTNATSVKAAPGQVYDIQVFNTNASPRFLKLYNKASTPVVGTDVPVKTLLIPGNTAGGGVVKNWDKGLEFTTGIAYALTTGVADADTGAVAANELVVNLDYK